MELYWTRARRYVLASRLWGGSATDTAQGTRVHVYRWLNNVHARKKATEADLRSLPELVTQKKWTKKTHPG